MRKKVSNINVSRLQQEEDLIADEEQAAQAKVRFLYGQPTVEIEPDTPVG